MSRRLVPAITFISLALYWLAVSLQDQASGNYQENPANVAIAAPIQVLLYGGDRFLAANIETIRAAASATAPNAEEYRLKAHDIVSQLNPCHEDNYWLGNASLTWGGAEDEGFELLKNTIHCRFWDEWPPFFYAFNQNFFKHDVPEARRFLEIAAQRSKKNAAAFRNFSAMLAAGEIDDTRAAIKMLINERNKAKDPKLRDMLDKRVIRLQGLQTLKDAQATYEKRYGKPLENPQQLLASGILRSYPQDPLKLGYDFHEHTFTLHKLKIR